MYFLFLILGKSRLLIFGKLTFRIEKSYNFPSGSIHSFFIINDAFWSTSLTYFCLYFFRYKLVLVGRSQLIWLTSFCHDLAVFYIRLRIYSKINNGIKAADNTYNPNNNFNYILSPSKSCNNKNISNKHNFPRKSLMLTLYTLYHFFS